MRDHTPLPPDPLSDEVLDRYLLGRATDAECRAVEAAAQAVPAFAPWVATVRESPAAAGRRFRLERVQELVEREVGFAVDGVDTRWRETHAVPDRIAKAGHSARGVLHGANVRVYFQWAIGGMTALVLAVGSLTLISDRQTSSSTTRVYVTRRSQQVNVTLPDSSRVILAPESRLVVPDAFGSVTRTLELQGQAHFAVTATSATPFIVRAGSVAVRVLGTVFDVRHYAAEPTVQVAVLGGKVSAITPRTSITITAGEAAHLTDSTATTMSPGDINQYTGWIRGRLVFNGTPVPVMLATLSRWYGYEFRISDSTLIHERVQAEFRTSAPEETMRLLKSVLDVSLTFDGSVVTLHPRRHTQTPIRWRRHELSPISGEIGK